MMSKLLVVVAALCVASAVAVTVDVDVINGYPSADSATFSFNGETVLSGVAYKGKASKDVTVTTAAPYKVEIGNRKLDGALSNAEVGALTALGDSWASFVTYQNKTMGPAVAFTGLPKSTVNGLTAKAMLVQWASTFQSDNSNYPNVKVAYMYSFTTETSGISVTTNVGPFTININNVGFGSYAAINDAEANNGVVQGVTYTNSALKFKLFDGNTAISSANDFDTKTALAQSGDITIKKGTAATCAIVGQCGDGDLTACGAKATYGLTVVCDEISWSGAAGALKPTVLFALLAAAVAMLFAW